MKLEILIIRSAIRKLHFSCFLASNNLREVHLCGYNYTFFSEKDLERLEKFREQKGRSFEIFVNGFYYEPYKRLSKEQKSTEWLQKNTWFLAQNLSHLAETVYMYLKVNYCQLEDLDDDKLSEFARKFINIVNVSVEKM